MEMEVQRFPGLEEMIRDAAERIIRRAVAAVTASGSFTVAVSGGTTPRSLYEWLGAPAQARRMPWNRSHIFFVDERAVPPDDPASNYGLLRATLLARVPLPVTRVHRMPAEAADAAAARQYESRIRWTVRTRPGARGAPAFDLILLGVGADGHTASLFPGDPLLAETRRLVAMTDGARGQPPVPRMTCTLPLINAATEAIFLAAGREKRAAVAAILGDPAAAAVRYPAARVRPVEKLTWLLDGSTL